MPRPLRYSPPGSVLHVVNRGNDKRVLFETPRDFEEFLTLVTWAKLKRPMRILAYCVMRNHWHFVLWSQTDGDVSAFLHLLTTTHAIRRRKHTGTIGHGHIYQDRYRAFPIFTEPYYWNTLRYVEANPLRACLVSTAADWPWSSLAERLGRDRGIVDEGPLPLPDVWLELVDECLPEALIEDIRKQSRKH